MVLIVDEVLRYVIGPSLSCGLADILGPLACGYLWDQGVVFGFHVVLPPFIFTMLLVGEAHAWHRRRPGIDRPSYMSKATHSHVGHWHCVWWAGAAGEGDGSQVVG